MAIREYPVQFRDPFDVAAPEQRSPVHNLETQDSFLQQYLRPHIEHRSWRPQTHSPELFFLPATLLGDDRSALQTRRSS